MAEVYLALGSNLGDRRQYLIQAVNSLQEKDKILMIAPLYRSSAYGYTNQPDFLNTALLLETTAKPFDLLKFLKSIEESVGRKQRIRWGPREIDLDIIFYDDEVLNTPDLVIPHPDFHNRRFVLQPLADIAPDFISPTHRKSVKELLNKCADKTTITLIAMEWYGNGLQI